MYKIINNKIIIQNKKDFVPQHILECGQIFRFEKIDKNYVVFSLDKKATIIETESNYEIVTNDIDYFINFFDLEHDYSSIKNKLINFNNEILNNAVNYGYGIRILKQSPFEMIISFIISANNNIPRIKSSIKKICEAYGKLIDNDYYAFPTLEDLSKANEDFFKSVGLGYRANYMVETLKLLKDIDFDNLKILSTQDLRNELMKLKGVGRKVAECIMLFGFNRLDVFPIDTWTKKVYNENFYVGDKNNNEIANYFVDFFGHLSGYAQQYLYYWKQTTKSK
ncbi:MAG: 8-oxoguanine DNA glycosylase [Clostridia bacterium]|nr:8-oxoguanine DNA glycosylase [Clostridia bacterium]